MLSEKHVTDLGPRYRRGVTKHKVAACFLLFDFSFQTFFKNIVQLRVLTYKTTEITALNQS